MRLLLRVTLVLLRLLLLLLLFLLLVRRDLLAQGGDGVVVLGVEDDVEHLAIVLHKVRVDARAQVSR